MKKEPQKPRTFSPVREVRLTLKSDPLTTNSANQPAFARLADISLISLQLIEAGKMSLSPKFANKIATQFFLDPDWLQHGKEGETPIADDQGPWSVAYYSRRKLESPQKDTKRPQNTIRGITPQNFGSRYGRLIEEVITALLESGESDSADLFAEAMVRIIDDALAKTGITMDVWKSMRQSDELRDGSEITRFELTSLLYLDYFQQIVRAGFEGFPREKTSGQIVSLTPAKTSSRPESPQTK